MMLRGKSGRLTRRQYPPNLTEPDSHEARYLLRHRATPSWHPHRPGRTLISIGLLSFALMSEATRRWICESCGFIYDPADGDPDGGIPPGTAFEDIPLDWYCPVCGARKRDFVPYED